MGFHWVKTDRTDLEHVTPDKPYRVHGYYMLAGPFYGMRKFGNVYADNGWPLRITWTPMPLFPETWIECNSEGDRTFGKYAALKIYACCLAVVACFVFSVYWYIL